MFIVVVSCLLILSSCNPLHKSGTIQSIINGVPKNVNDSNNLNIEVYIYYVGDDAPIYVARFKDSPEVVTTTWIKREGKTTRKKSSITINEETIKKEKIAINREKITLNGYELWLDRSSYPKIWLYSSETAKNEIPVDVLYNGKLISSPDLNDIEKKELLNYLNMTR